jgi:hypothetical protein
MRRLAPVPIAGSRQVAGMVGMSVVFKTCLRKARG